MSELGVASLGFSVLQRDPAGQHRLAGSRCPGCGDVRVPRREFCVNDGLVCEHTLLAGTGTIYEAVLVSVPPTGFDAPFWTGYIDLDEGPRVFAQLAYTDGQAPLCHGQRVAMGAEAIGTRAVLAPVFHRI